MNMKLYCYNLKLLKKLKIFLYLAVFTSLLTGCVTSSETEFTFYEEERWHFNGSFVVPNSSIEDPRTEESVKSELLDEIHLEEMDVELTWQKEEYDKDSTVYHVNLKGTGLDDLNLLFFDREADIRRIGEHVHISYYIPSLWDRYLTLSSLTVNGGRVVSSNADEVTETTAVWYYPAGIVEVVLVEKQITNLPLILFFILAFLLAGALLFRSLRRI